MLKLSHLTKTFHPGTPDAKTALDDLSLDVRPGDFISIIGANGAGKSTLFNAIAGSVLTDAGKILLDGQDVTLRPEHKRARLIGDNLQLLLGVPSDDADGDGGLNPLLAAGIGDDDTFDILQNIPADRGRDFVRQTAQQGAHFCGAVGNGDGLGAAGGQHELLLQNGDIVFVNSIVEHSVHLIRQMPAPVVRKSAGR